MISTIESDSAPLEHRFTNNQEPDCAFVPSSDAERALGIMEAYQEKIGDAKTACAIGQVREQREHVRESM